MHGAEPTGAVGLSNISTGVAGRGALTFSRVGDRTAVRRAFSTSPLKLLNPRYHGSAAWIYLASYGGGLVGGDALQLDIEVQRGAAAVIATQSSTRVYRSPRGASQAVRAEVADEALLVLAPDPVVCFAKSSYTQDLAIRLAPRAALVLVDWLGAGRVASGERWQFDRFNSVTQLWHGERRMLYDALRLTPEDGGIAGRMGRFNTLLTVIVAGPPLAAEAARILGEVAAMPLETKADLVVSASPIGELAVLLRIAAVSTERAGETLRRLLAFLPPLLGGDPWSRKW